MNCNV